MKSLKIALVGLGLVHLSFVQGMDKKPEVFLHQVPSKDKARYLTKDWFSCIKATYQNTKDISQSSISINANIITDKKLVKELTDAYNAGVRVNLLVSQNSLSYMKKSKGWGSFLQQPKPPFPFKVFLNRIGGSVDHAKFFLTRYADAEGKIQYCYSVGSSNFTPSGEYQSNETVEFVKNYDFDNYTKLQKTFDDVYAMGVTYEPGKTTEGLRELQNEQMQNIFTTPVQQRSKNKIIEMTPEKRTLYSTFESSVWQSIGARLNKYHIETDKKSGFIYISSMTWNLPELTDKLCDAADDNFEVKIFVDKAALRTEASRKQLLNMLQHKVKVFVYFGSGFKLQHAKFALIHKTTDKEKKIVVSTTQNVSQDNEDFDIFIIDPKNPALFEDYIGVVKTYEKHANMHQLTEQNFNEWVKLSYAAVKKEVPEQKKSTQKEKKHVKRELQFPELEFPKSKSESKNRKAE